MRPEPPRPRGLALERTAVRVVVDTDAAPDDLVAIAFLLAAPWVTVEAITVVGTGEVRCSAGMRIVLGLLDRLGAPTIPVACGPETAPALGLPFPPWIRERAERAGGLSLPASARQPAGDAVTLLGEAFAVGGPTRLLALGPLTNIALALDADPTLASRIESAWIMGGAVDAAGNVAGTPGVESDNTAAEWNVIADPAALATVLSSGVTGRLVSLDGTNQVPIRATFVEQVLARRRASPAIEVLAELCERDEVMTGEDSFLWDPLAAIFAAGVGPGSFTPARIVVDLDDGRTMGATRRVDGEPNASYLTRVDADRAEAILIETLAAG